MRPHSVEVPEIIPDSWTSVIATSFGLHAYDWLLKPRRPVHLRVNARRLRERTSRHPSNHGVKDGPRILDCASHSVKRP